VKYQHEQIPEDRQLYANAENQARDAKVGLWQENNSYAALGISTALKISVVLLTQLFIADL